MPTFSLINRSSGSSYFFIETVTTSSFYDKNSVEGALGTYSNFTGSTIFNFSVIFLYQPKSNDYSR